MGNINATEARVGTVIVIDGNLKEVMEYNHIKPGKGPAKVRIRTKGLKDGKVVEYTVGISESFQMEELDLKDMQYLYKEGEGYVFMDSETYEQVSIPALTLGDQVNYLLEQATAAVTFHGTEAIGLKLPAAVNLKVVETLAAVKGNTVNNATKEARVETGFNLQVPMFVNEGDLIRIDTRTGKYLERA